MSECGNPPDPDALLAAIARLESRKKEPVMGRIKPPAPEYVGPTYRSSGLGNKPINRVVIHSTVSPCEPGGARRIGAYFRSPSAGGSAHYIVDPGEVLQSAYDSVIAWHAPPNSNSLGVEMCDIPGPVPGDKPGSARWKALKKSWRWTRPNQRKMLRRTAKLTAQLCLAYDVPIRFLSPADLRAGKRGITTHANVSLAFRQSSHWDPGFWPRAHFMRLVRKYAKKLQAPEPEPEPEPKKSHPLKVVAVWNMRVGRGAAAIRGLRHLIRDTNADAVLLQEAKNYVPAIRAAFPNWRVYGGPGFVERSNNVIMVRRKIKRGKHGKVVNRTPWVFSRGKDRVEHEGRVWRWVRVDGVALMSVHKSTNALGDNLEAGCEEADNLADWFDSHARPLAAFGDFNNRARDPRTNAPADIAKRVGGALVAAHPKDIDLGITVDLPGTWERGEKYDSDHHSFTFTPDN